MFLYFTLMVIQHKMVFLVVSLLIYANCMVQATQWLPTVHWGRVDLIILESDISTSFKVNGFFFCKMPSRWQEPCGRGHKTKELPGSVLNNLICCVLSQDYYNYFNFFHVFVPWLAVSHHSFWS